MDRISDKDSHRSPRMHGADARLTIMYNTQVIYYNIVPRVGLVKHNCALTIYRYSLSPAKTVYQTPKFVVETLTNDYIRIIIYYYTMGIVIPTLGGVDDNLLSYNYYGYDGINDSRRPCSIVQCYTHIIDYIQQRRAYLTFRIKYCTQI